MLLLGSGGAAGSGGGGEGGGELVEALPGRGGGGVGSYCCGFRHCWWLGLEQVGL